jgi:hypothetical protein
MTTRRSVIASEDILEKHGCVRSESGEGICFKGWEIGYVDVIVNVYQFFILSALIYYIISDHLMEKLQTKTF